MHGIHLKKLIPLIWIVILAFAGTAYADVENGLVVTSLSMDKQEIFAGKKTDVIVTVVEAKLGSDRSLAESVPSTNSVVNVTLKQGEKQIPLTLIHAGDGKYKGSVTFPEAGTWQVSAVAEYADKGKQAVQADHKDDHAEESLQNVFETTVDVKESRTTENFMIWAAVFLLIAGMQWLLVRKLKKNG